MERREALFGLGSLAFGASLLLKPGSARANGQDKHAKHYSDCAAECSKCMTECEECYRHCSDLVASGRREHAACMQLCNDGAEICGVAARLSARQGPLAVPICEACAKACDVCAAECEKFPNMAECMECAEHCRKCAKACREMIQHVAG